MEILNNDHAQYQEKTIKLTFTDRILVSTILKFLPKSVTPNHITVIRFILIPVVLYFLFIDEIALALFLFMIAAFSDALDGALARSTSRISEWGTLYDPLADKLLVGSVIIFVVSKYVDHYLAGAIIFVEILLIINAYYRKKKYGKVVPAHMSGKIKMLLQSVGLITLILYSMFDARGVLVSELLTVGTIILYVSLFFALISLFVYRSV